MFPKMPLASYRGIVTHTLSWLTSRAGDYYYENPHYIAAADGTPGISIYCTHGTADRAASFLKVAKRLLKKKLPSSVCSMHLAAFEGRFRGQTIEEFAQQLVAKILQNGDRRVVLLGHSRGGLVNAYMTEYLAQASDIQVDMLFNVGTPFLGSKWAMAPMTLFSASVEQMQVGSEFLLNLTERINHSSARYFFIIAKEDGIVGAGLSHIQTYVEQHPDSLLELETEHGHLSMTTSRELVDLIHARLLPVVPEAGVVTLYTHWKSFRIIKEYQPEADRLLRAWFG